MAHGGKLRELDELRSRWKQRRHALKPGTRRVPAALSTLPRRSAEFFKLLEHFQRGFDTVLRHEQHSAFHADAETHDHCRNVRTLQCNPSQITSDCSG